LLAVGYMEKSMVVMWDRWNRPDHTPGRIISGYVMA